MAADQGDKRDAETKNGTVVTLLGETLARAGRMRGGTQRELFDPADPLPGDDKGSEAPGPKGPGRPAGARNKVTEELRAWARSRFGDPGLKLMEMIFADPIAMAQALGADSAWDVRVKQMEWAMRMVPFFWAAMPQELKVQTKGFLAVAVQAMPGGSAGDRITDLDPLTALLEFQGLSRTPINTLNGAPLNVEQVSDDDTEG